MLVIVTVAVAVPPCTTVSDVGENADSEVGHRLKLSVSADREALHGDLRAWGRILPGGKANHREERHYPNQFHCVRNVPPLMIAACTAAFGKKGCVAMT